VEELQQATGLTGEQIHAAVEWMEREAHDDP
jgi:NADH:ubiquinone oxidoreductase subunit C